MSAVPAFSDDPNSFACTTDACDGHVALPAGGRLISSCDACGEIYHFRS